MEISDYLRAVRRRWKIVLVPAAIACLLGGLLALVLPKTYTSEVEVLVSVDAQSGQLADASAFLQDMTPNFVAMAASPAVLNPVIKEVGLDTTATSLAKKVVATQNSGTTVINVQVKGSSAKQAHDTAEKIALELSKQITGMNPSPSKDGGATTKFVPVTVTPATTPTSPSAPSLPVFLIAGLLLGLIAGVVRAVQLEGRAPAAQSSVAAPRDINRA